MATHKHIDAICTVIVVCTLLLTVLFMNGKALGVTAVLSEENSDEMFTANDLAADWDALTATEITLSDEGSTVRGNGAYVYDGDVHIVYAGKYVLSGALSDGAIYVEADGDDKIWLMLRDVSVHCEDGAALRVEQAGKVFLTLPEGSENTLSSGAAYGEEAVSAGVDGTIYSRDDLTVNGAGALSVTAEYAHGVVCNDDLVVTDGTLRVTAPQDAVHANDSVRIREAALTLSAGDDGITVSNDADTAFLYVESGSVTVPSCTEGLEAVQITVAGGKLDISATDDGLNANGYSGNSLINITGGELTVTVPNGRDADGLDSNKDIAISGGKIFVSVSDSGGSCAIDYGSENGGTCEITGGTVLACGSSGMAEGFDSSSTQGFLMQTVSAAAGTTVTVRDDEGSELISEQVPCSFSSVLVSTPEMQVGDTCTLVVGDTETEMTIDNSSNGGFGGFGGGRMFGGNGQMQGRGGFAKNGGAFGGDFADPTEDSAETQDSGRLSAAASTLAVQPLSAAGADDLGGNMAGNAPPDMQNGSTPPGFPGNGDGEGMQPPELPDGTEGSVTLPELPQTGAENDLSSDQPEETLPEDGQNENAGGGLQQGIPQGGTGEGMQPPELSDGTAGSVTPPELPQTGGENELSSGLPEETLPEDGQNEDAGGGLQNGIPQGGAFGGRFGGREMQNQNWNMAGQENAAPSAETGTPVSGEQLLLVGVSALVLLIGCAIAAGYKRRG